MYGNNKKRQKTKKTSIRCPEEERNRQMQTEKKAFTGKIWRLGDDVDTDIIIPTEYLALPTVAAMAPYAFSPLRPKLAGQIQPGDIIVAGKNFGCGSSREQAPEVIKALGVACVVAKSYARIFFRNAVNNGLWVVECPDLPELAEGETITVKPGDCITRASAAGGNTCEFPLSKMPQNVQDILEGGGLVAQMRRLNGLLTPAEGK